MAGGGCGVNVRSPCEVAASGAQDVRVPAAGGDLPARLAAWGLPAFAVDESLRILFWNRGAERLFGRSPAQALGRRCFDVVAGRDVFGNRYCHAGCPVVAMVRRGERVRSFEIVDVRSPEDGERRLWVTIAKLPGARPGLARILHLLSLCEMNGSRWRTRPGRPAGNGSSPPGGGARTLPTWAVGSLTGRELEVLGWIAAGLPNKEIAQGLRISLATVRNHVHNLLLKIGVHSKLQAVSLAFQLGWLAADGSGPAGRPEGGERP
jgi:DNA-binding CsgD family transcriptional regulator